MADAIFLQRRGIPSVAICTRALTASADAMARLLGVEDFPYAVIDHPIANLSPDELRQRAKDAVPQILHILREGRRPRPGPA